MHCSHISWRCARRGFPTCHGSESPAWGGPGEEMDYDRFGGGSFGVRRPLRFLAHRLGLDDRQIAELARILDALKTERAQAEVDRRRSVAAFADALGSDTFDAARAAEGGRLRVQSAERLRDAVQKALGEIHAMLRSEQRVQLAYLIRTGTLAI
jgi:Spy/CpxP family protein refolding chaperone